MEETLKYAVGVDIGTENVRGVIAVLDKTGPRVVGYHEVQNSGMRKGELVNLVGPANAIDQVLDKMERMSGIGIKSATVSINGAHITSEKINSMITIGGASHSVDTGDLNRIQDEALLGRVPQNMTVLDLIPFEYRLDGQGGIRNPLGMTGTRLDMRANMVLAMSQKTEDIRRMMEETHNIKVHRVVPTVLASGNAVLTQRQMENGVAVVDYGAATTGVAIFDEGELQCLFVLPVGANMVTKDLANILEVDMDTAEEIKRRFVDGLFSSAEETVTFKKDRQEYTFSRQLIDDCAKARLADTFGIVKAKIDQSGYGFKLPEGIILVGGGTKMRNLESFAKEVLHTSVKIGKPLALSGLSEVVQPEYATAVGLMIFSIDEDSAKTQGYDSHSEASSSGSPIKGLIGKIFGKF